MTHGRTMHGFPVLALIFLAGCYASARSSHDAAEDPSAEDPSVDGFEGGDSSCIRFDEPAFEGLDYADTVSEATPFTLTVHHGMSMGCTASYRLDGSVIDVTLGGMTCLCTPCPIEMPSSTVTSFMVEGLEAGEYTIDIQGNLFPLHVTGGCERSLLGIAGDADCPAEARVNQAVEIGFTGSGRSCGCNGSVETGSTQTPPAASLWGELRITADEVVCDPASCCNSCPCIDMYDVKATVAYEEEGLYQNYANDQWICMTAVFGEDGCSHWPALDVAVTAHTSWVQLPPDGTGATASFMLSLSTGLCCNPEPVVVTANQGRDPDDPFRITIHEPSIGICEGDCCFACACVDSYSTEIFIHDLMVAGTYTVCVDGDACYTFDVTS